jgi:hypothetical protein
LTNRTIDALINWGNEMNAYQIPRRGFFSLALALAASLMLAGCNYPTRVGATATANLVPTSLPSETAAPSATPQPSDTSAPSVTSSATPLPSETPGPSNTPGATATQPAEQIGVVILNGQEIGSIQKSGEKFTYIADPHKLTPEVEGKVVLQIKDSQQKWGFNLESSSSSMYNFKEDPRSGWEGFGVLVAYEGSYEITIKFVAVNVQSGEKLNGRVRIKIVGATVLATDTPEVESP